MKQELRHPFAIRFFHWWNMVAITILILTGFYIHSPLKFRLFSNMDTARYLHFIMMYFLIFGVIGRLYYMFATGDYRNILFQPSDIKKFPSMIKYYLFLTNRHPYYGKYNPGQKMMYTGVFVLAIVQIITGFILYWPTKMSYWAYLLGGPIIVRMIHYCVTWVFVLSVLVHVYLDIAEGFPILRSMFTGYMPTDFYHGDHEEEQVVPTGQKASLKAK
ncbi:MAG: Ni/Fe-hydrogenase, b-type cytochrome subunit [Firmicutes bacterium]|nr:Ni/Fe-hydrogenase, b-type cytochrome subunit [Bacillota bacterium]